MDPKDHTPNIGWAAKTKDLADGVALNLEHGEKVTSPGLITSCLSLYFQWPEHRSCHINLPHIFAEDGSSVSAQCVLNYDTDEAVPSEIYVGIDDLPLLARYRNIEFAVVQFEVFNVSYRFQVKILGLDPTSKTMGLILDAPTTLVVQKQRAIPRVPYKISGQTVSLKHGKMESSVTIVEIGVESLIADTELKLFKDDTVLVSIGKTDLQATVVRTDGSRVILELEFSSVESYSLFFELYLTCAFSTLHPRKESDLDSVLSLYKKSGFFNKFLASKTSDQSTQYLAELKETWSSLSNEHGHSSFDYVSTSKDVFDPVAASSLTMGFALNGSPVWVMQQLCALKEEELFENTRQIYLWRPALLSAIDRGQNTKSVCWFDGSSRWIERIWVKFALQSGIAEQILWPVTIYVSEITGIGENGSISSIETESKKMGAAERYFAHIPDSLLACSPSKLNSAELLNLYSAVPPQRVDQKTIDQIGQFMRHHSEQRFRFVATDDVVPAFDNLSKHPLNRMCLFEVSLSSVLYSATDHSIAVIERKRRFSEAS